MRHVNFVLREGIEELWDRLLQLPDFSNGADLFRAMIRSFAEKYNVVPTEKKARDVVTDGD